MVCRPILSLSLSLNWTEQSSEERIHDRCVIRLPLCLAKSNWKRAHRQNYWQWRTHFSIESKLNGTLLCSSNSSSRKVESDTSPSLALELRTHTYTWASMRHSLTATVASANAHISQCDLPNDAILSVYVGMLMFARSVCIDRDSDHWPTQTNRPSTKNLNT